MAIRSLARVGIFGGSFNPVHKGHIKLAETALSALNLDRVIFVPTYQTPLKKKKLLLSPQKRLLCLRRALRPQKRFYVSDHEIKQGGVSYTVDTLRYFKKKFGPKTVLYFLVGADQLKNLSRWKSFDRVLKLCRFAVFSRPGYPGGNRLPRRMIWVPMEALPISASDIRERARQGRAFRDKVPTGTAHLWIKG